MTDETFDNRIGGGSSGPKRPLSYSENVDEAPKAMDREPVEIEESTTADQRSSVEQLPRDDRDPPVFEG